MHPASLAPAAAGRRDAGHPETRRLLFSAALVRIADALDASHLQDALVVSVRAMKRTVRVSVRSGGFSPGIEPARRQAALCREAFPVDLDLRLLAGPAPVPLLKRSLSLPEGVQRLLFLQYRTMEANVRGAVAGDGEEALHDLRIAVRRMRAVLRAFRKPLAGTSAARIDGDLQRLNRVLGLARDLDVWIGFFSTESVSAQFTGHRLWARFVAHQLELRRLQQATVRRQLHGSGFAALQLRIGRLLRVELPAAAASSPEPSLERSARRALLKSLRRALDLGSLRKSRSAEKLHRLRIALRRLRYLGSFFAPVLGRPVRRLTRRTHALERMLGEMRDADLVLSRIAQEGPTPPRLLVRQLERLRKADGTALEEAWGRFEDPVFIRGLRRALER
jgi:CHAD domain-containing protein